ncbi:MAG TPA: AIR synthase-related protein, partial [Rhizobacter sp.]|jgi:selenide,water dikinase|nr:AIR synthase-related protein [Rhizobacter sp.]
MCRGSGLAAEIALADVPLIESAREHARQGIATGASARNWAGYGAQVSLAPSVQPWQQALLTDPQTSGGLLVSCSAAASESVLARFRAAGFDQAAVIGHLQAGPPGLKVLGP